MGNAIKKIGDGVLIKKLIDDGTLESLRDGTILHENEVVAEGGYGSMEEDGDKRK